MSADSRQYAASCTIDDDTDDHECNANEVVECVKDQRWRLRCAPRVWLVAVRSRSFLRS